MLEFRCYVATLHRAAAASLTFLHLSHTLSLFWPSVLFASEYFFFSRLLLSEALDGHDRNTGYECYVEP